MINNIRFTINKPFFYFQYILVFGLFLLDSGYLIFGKPTAKDIVPMGLMDIFYLLVIILQVRRHISLASHNLTALELNENEIIDYISNIRLNWRDISDIRFKRVGNGCQILVYMNDKKQVIRQSKNIFKKIGLYITMLIFGTPIRIFPSYIKGENVEIFNKISGYFKQVNVKANIG